MQDKASTDDTAGQKVPARSLRIAVAIATVGRPETVELTAARWTAQTRPYDHLVFSVANAGDVGPGARALPKAIVLLGPKGLTKQRNLVLDHLAGACDLIVYADDDFVPATSFLENVERLFIDHPELAVATGWVIADGINTAGISFTDALRIVSDWEATPGRTEHVLENTKHAYGCNMIVRPDARPDLRFDERLPLYGWLEDLDYCRRMSPYGRIQRSSMLVGVHMGVKGGRQSGVRLGYSQVANPIYFVIKGSMPAGEAFVQVLRNLCANILKALRPEPWVDRPGRLKGNCLALADALMLRLRPERIEEL